MTIHRSKMKVCHLASGDLWAGAEAQIAQLCRGLLETGAVQFSAIVLNEGRLAEELRSLGADVTVIDEQMYAWWQILRQIIRYMRRRPPDILHTHRYKENILGCLAARMSQVPYVLRTVHGTGEVYSGWRWVKTKIYGALDHLACRYCVNLMVGVSREICDVLGYRFRGRRIIYIPNCVDERSLVITCRRQEKRIHLGLKPSEFVIGTVGRLARVKGTEYLIRALPEIIKRCKDVHLLVIGDGPLRAGLEALTQSMGLNNNVTFLGWRDDCADIINALDLLVLPSIHEGMPTVLLEAMSLGVPVVASATGGVRELITHGETGFLVEPKDVHGLAETCSVAITDPVARETVASNCLRFVTATYRVATIADTYMSHYCRLLDGQDHDGSPK